MNLINLQKKSRNIKKNYLIQLLIIPLVLIAIACSCFTTSITGTTVPIDQAPTLSNVQTQPESTDQNPPSSGVTTSKAFLFGIEKCVRQTEGYIGIGTYSTKIQSGWKAYNCPIWIKADKGWVNQNDKLGSLFLQLEGSADFSQLAPYQQGSFYVMTSSDVKYPVALIKLDYGYSDSVPIFPGVSVKGFFLQSMIDGSISLIRQEFVFMIPESMTADYIVYTQDGQHIKVPSEGQVIAPPSPEGNFASQLPFTVPFDQFVTIKISDPIINQNASKVSFILNISASNGDATASHIVDSLVNIVDSNGLSWGPYGCQISLGPSQSTTNQCTVGLGSYSMNEIPSSFYIGIDGFDQPYFFKLSNDQIRR